MQATTVGNGQQQAAQSGAVAVILAGGLGMRLRSVVADRNKTMALVDGEPFLLRILDQLAAAGFGRVVLCTGHGGQQLAAELGHEHAGMQLEYSQEAEPLGTGGALRLALPRLASEAVLVLNGDSYVDADLGHFLRWARQHELSAALLAVSVAERSRYGALQLAADGQVLSFGEKAALAGPGWINAGVYWFRTALLARLLAQRLPLVASSLERELLPALVGEGLRALPVAAAFLDIGLPADYAAASAFFAAVAQRQQRPRKGLLVVDRDGTLIEERHYLADPAQVALLPGVVDGLRSFVDQGYEIVVVTNQSGLGRGLFSATALQQVNEELQRQLLTAGIALRAIYVCPHTPTDHCDCRKPAPRMLLQAMSELGYDRQQVLVVGDKACDVELGHRLGVRTALVRTGYGAGTERDGLCTPDLIVDNLRELAVVEVCS